MGRCHSKLAMKNEQPMTVDCAEISLVHSSPHCDIIHRPKTAAPLSSHRSPLISSTVQSPPIGQPRALFVSLYALWIQWEDIDCETLFHAIVIINGCKEELFPQTVEDMRASLKSPFLHMPFTEHFLQLIQMKDRQGTVIWMKETRANNENNPASTGNSSITEIQRTFSVADGGELSIDMIEVGDIPVRSVSPQWNHISNQLCGIVDPVTNDPYTRLSLAPVWWSQRQQSELQYCVSPDPVCTELWTCGGNYKAISELVKQSNPTLIPMITFDRCEFETKTTQIRSDFITSTKDHDLHTTEKRDRFGNTSDKNGFVWLDYNDGDY